MNRSSIILFLAAAILIPQKLLAYPFFQIKQGNKIFLIQDGAKISLRPEAFIFIFRIHPYDTGKNIQYASQLAVDINKALLYIPTGTKAEQTACFAPGTGMASETGKPYDNLYLGSNAHHYLMYDPAEPDNRRAWLIKSLTDGKLELEWPVRSVFINGQSVLLENFTEKYLYMVYFYDANLNNRIDRGELLRFTVGFK